MRCRGGGDGLLVVDREDDKVALAGDAVDGADDAALARVVEVFEFGEREVFVAEDQAVDGGAGH